METPRKIQQIAASTLGAELEQGLGTPIHRWKPSKEQCRTIKLAAAREVGIKANQIKLCPGRRINVNDESAERSINIARVTRQTDGEWADTDLDDRVEWSSFKKGVPLTDDGRAVVDFYIHRYGDDADLEGNVIVFFQEGQLSKIQGYAIREHLIK